MKGPGSLSPAKRKRLLRTYGPYPVGYTHDDLERLLDLLYRGRSKSYSWKYWESR